MTEKDLNTNADNVRNEKNNASSASNSTDTNVKVDTDVKTDEQKLHEAKEDKNTVVVTKRGSLKSNVFIIVALPLIFLISTVAVSIPLALQVARGAEINIAMALGLTIISELLVVATYIMFTKNMIPIKWTKKLGFQNFSWKWFILSAIIGIIAFFTLQITSIAITQLTGLEMGSSETSMNVFESVGIARIFALFIVVPLLAPIVEEILFRGVVFNGLLLGRLGTFASFLVAGFFFAIVHTQGFSTPADIFLLVWIFVLAIVHCLVFYKTRSIYNAMAMHVAYNSTTVFIPLIFLGF